jgi:ankyrin repeat protein
MACQNNHVKIVNALLARKEIQINQTANEGATPLLIACQNNYLKVVMELLTQEGIEINKPMNDGTTPLIIASYLGNSSVVEVLLSHADITTTGTVDDKTAYDCSKANMRIAKWSFADDKINENGRKKCQSLLKLFETKK